MSDPATTRSSAFDPGCGRDRYRAVIIVLAVLMSCGAAGAVAGSLATANPVLLDAAVTMGLAAALVIGLAMSRPPGSSPGAIEKATSTAAEVRLPSWLQNLAARANRNVRLAAAGVFAGSVALLLNIPIHSPGAVRMGIAAVLCLAAAGLAAAAVRYLSEIDLEALPEASWLCRGARVLAWILVLSAFSMGLVWAGQRSMLLIARGLVVTVNVWLCYDLFAAASREPDLKRRPLGAGGALWILGSRANILSGMLDAAEQRLGIDVRSTWALTIVRRSVEPLVIGLCFIGWLSTSLTVIGIDEHGIIERLGLPLKERPLDPGLHLHWPWPVDQVFRVPVLRVHALTIGNEAKEQAGPEDVLWTVDHVKNEYTLLLGDGRDLITIDASVQFRIKDVWAWHYRCQNPSDALKAIAYRAVMRSTADRTEAEALGLGVEIVGFTVGAMHPPVRVAAAYQQVVSAEIGKSAAMVNAETVRTRIVSAAEAAAITSVNTAKAEGARNVARAAGEAWSFRALQSQYRAGRSEYLFRRRLETLEQGLSGRRFTVVDSRFQRDGGELWLTQ
jgi:regulator of protease activity HflC (stomatin/prohibitin superfamily)